MSSVAWCLADQGYCDRSAVAYVFGGPSRRTIVTGPRALELAAMTPENARCADHAIDEMEDAVQAAMA